MTFYWTTATLVFTALVLVAAAVCCFISWKRSGFTRSMGLLECLRFIRITAALLTLNQPELKRETRPDERPTLVVLHDTSDSMQTLDVVSTEDPEADAIRRNVAAAPAIKPEM